MSTDAMKVFHLSRSMLAADLQRIEAQYGIEMLPHQRALDDTEDSFYPQFPSALRHSAKQMAQHYEIFYCLENYIRDLVVEQLVSLHGEAWWEERVPQGVKDNVSFNMKRELDAGVTPRSPDLIDYTTFGELSTVIDSNWQDFGDIFNSRKGLVSVLSRLNLLRGPIAHCSALSEDEVMRLRLTLADWFRLMG